MIMEIDNNIFDGERRNEFLYNINSNDLEIGLAVNEVFIEYIYNKDLLAFTSLDAEEIQEYEL